MFRSASTDLDHALIVYDLTQILEEGSGYRWGGAVGIPDHDSWWDLDPQMGQVADNQCVIKICRSRSKRRSFVSANSLQRTLKFAIILILGAMNNIFHIMTVLCVAR